MYKFILAFRYLVRRRISYFAVAAVALCVFVVFVVITVMTGLANDFKTKVYRSVGDCVVYTKSLVGFGYYQEFLEILRQQPYIEAASPVIKNYALVGIGRVAGRSAYGEYTKEIAGIEPVSYAKVTAFGEWLQYNKDKVSKAFEPAYDLNLPGCIPGIDFLFGRDEKGDYHLPDEPTAVALEINCVPLNAKGALSKAGAGEFSTKTFYCSDYSHTGYSLDWRFIFLPFDDVQMLCGMATGHKRITHIHIKFTSAVSIYVGVNKVERLWAEFVELKKDAPHANLLENVKVQGWNSFSRTIVALVETQQTMMIVCFAMIGVITVFIVLVVFYMIVSHKIKDIGILKSVGTDSFSIVSIFLYFASLIGVVGSAVGAFIGWLFLIRINAFEDWLFEKFEFQLWDRRISSIGDIPSAIDLKVLAIIIICAIAACMLGALLPSCKASRMKCVDTLQVSGL